MKVLFKIFAVAAACAAAVACGTSRNSAVPTAENDEIINIGYGVTTKKANNNASGKVKVREKEVTAYSSIYDYLRGRVPGVDVQAGDKIVIRGVGTNSGETDPLILVDGVEMTDISSIDPNNVDSIDVLKDGSASIYGARGGNGVILITLKR
ncbi:MAG: TonB-dependent receptor plug domain-containing protein [Bacteroidales bacterium]|nr:TonB-dependent receptor plug domain-containing protein [Bacteroidales bacterium]